MSVRFNNMNTTDPSFCQNKPVCRAPLEKVRRKKGGKWQVGKEWKDSSKEPMLSSGTVKMEVARAGLVWNLLQLLQISVIIIFQGGVQRWYCLWDKTLCQKDPVGTSTLPTEREVLCQAHLSTEMKETTVVSCLVPFLMALHHMQTQDLSATLMRTPVCCAGKLFESLPLQATSPHFGPPRLKWKPLPTNIIYII